MTVDHVSYELTPVVRSHLLALFRDHMYQGSATDLCKVGGRVRFPLAPLKGNIMKEIKKEVKKPRDDSKDTNVLLACMLKELEDFNKYLKFMARMEAADHGIEME